MLFAELVIMLTRLTQLARPTYSQKGWARVAAASGRCRRARGPQSLPGPLSSPPCVAVESEGGRNGQHYGRRLRDRREVVGGHVVADEVEVPGRRPKSAQVPGYLDVVAVRS